jgi:hypothetical protein
MGFNNNIGLTNQASNQGVAFPGANTGMKPQLPQESISAQAPYDGNPMVRPQTVNPYIKDSGAQVNFNPKSAQAINGMFGTPMQNSYDRTMTPYDGSNFSGDQSMY